MNIPISESLLQTVAIVAAIYCATVHLIRGIRDVLIERQTTTVKLANIGLKSIPLRKGE